MKRKAWLVLVLTPSIFMAVSASKAYANGNLEAYIEALEYGLRGLMEYFEFIIALFEVA